MPSTRSLTTALTLAVAHAWSDCEFPDVGYFALDHGVGVSYAYAVAAMNGKLYSGGYTKGNFQFHGLDGSGNSVQPVNTAIITGDPNTNRQSLYIAEVDSTGKMQKSWLFQGTALQVGTIGHGSQTNSIDSHSGMHKMMDKAHIAVKGGFRHVLTLPDGTEWSTLNRLYASKDRAKFVMKLDVGSQNGVGAGTTGWAVRLDDMGSSGYPGGGTVYSVDGDASGNMIVSYKGCQTFNATATGTDAYGRPTTGAAEDCKFYIEKLAAADGSSVWRHEVPHELYSCRVITDGSFFCGWTMSSADGTLDFGNGVTVADGASYTTGVIKFNNAGVAQWGKKVGEASMGDLAVSADGTVLVLVGSPGSRQPGAVLRVDTSAGNEGNVLWVDTESGVGSHGFRGVEVTGAGSNEVVVFGQITDKETLTDAQGKSIDLRSRGSYDVFVASLASSDGNGNWAMNGGGTGMEYFFAMAADQDTYDIYVGGTSRSETITWGDITHDNPMYNGQAGENNPDTRSPTGSSKAFVVQITTTMSIPSCLTQCNTIDPLAASDVKSGYCYIDRHCYSSGQFADYYGAQCYHCEPDSSADGPTVWTGPDTTTACHITENGVSKCYSDGSHKQVRSGRYMVDDPCLTCQVDKSTSAWSALAGCELDGEFAAGCYTSTGAMTMTESEFNAFVTTMEDDVDAEKASADAANQQKNTLLQDKTKLQTQKTILEGQLTEANANLATEQASLDKCNEDLAACNALAAADKGVPSGVAIGLICAVSGLFVIVLLALLYIVFKEKSGAPVFVPVKPYPGAKGAGAA